MKIVRIISSLVILVFTSMGIPPLFAKTTSSTFGDDLKFLRQHQTTILLSDESGASQVAVLPAYQGRVMTSTADGEAGMSFGWINRELIGSGEVKEHINAFGGEDRFWLGPEGGQFGLFFAKGAPFDLAHWFTPAALDTEAFPIVSQDEGHVEFERRFKVINTSGTKFDLTVHREVRLLSATATWEKLGLARVEGVKMVAYETINRLKNSGEQDWKKESGLLSIWILGMFNPSPDTTIVIPIKPGPDVEMGLPVNTDYFGEIPKDRLAVKENFLCFKGDGQFRSKLGILPKRARPILGSYDAKSKLLTLVQYNLPPSQTDYVNSQWKIQDHPFGGDVVNSYNDGPPAPGVKPLGPFYEMETSSPAAELAKGQALEHIHCTIHIQGSEGALDSIAHSTLQVGLREITSALLSSQ